MKVTIRDVAKEANVSAYVPNAMARGLAAKNTNILAVIVPKGAEDMFGNQFYIQAMKGMSICAEEKNTILCMRFRIIQMMRQIGLRDL